MNAYKFKVKRACSQPDEEDALLVDHSAAPLEGWDCGPEYRVIRTVAEPSVGAVALGIENSSKQPVFIKRYEDIFSDITHSKRVLRELILLSKASSSPSLTRLVLMLLPSDPLEFSSFNIILEHSQHSLQHLLESRKTLALQEVTTIMRGLLQAVGELHRRGVVHRCLLPSNILVNPDDLGQVKLSDFGQVRVLQESKRRIVISENGRTRGSSKRKLSGIVSSRNYRAPELVLMQADFGSSVDLWAVGCIFGELLSKLEGAPFAQMNLPLFCESLESSIRLPKQSKGADAQSRNEDESNSTRKPLLGQDQAQRHDGEVLSIFRVIGSPSEEEMAHLDQAVTDYLWELPLFPRQDLKERFPGAPQSALDLISKLLKFAPDDRLTLEEAEAHPFFSQLPKGRAGGRTKPIKFGFEEAKVLDLDIMREHFLRELLQMTEALEMNE